MNYVNKTRIKSKTSQITLKIWIKIFTKKTLKLRIFKKIWRNSGTTIWVWKSSLLNCNKNAIL